MEYKKICLYIFSIEIIKLNIHKQAQAKLWYIERNKRLTVSALSKMPNVNIKSKINNSIVIWENKKFN